MVIIMKKIIIILVIIAIVALVSFSVPMMIYTYAERWSYNASFAEYQEEFVLVKNYVYENITFDEYVLLSYDKSTGETTLYSPTEKAYLDLPYDVQIALKEIDQNAFTYKDANFDTIRIEKDRIAFCVENGQYALVWSLSTPSGLNQSSDNAKTYVRQINDEWYHIRRNNG